MAIRDVVIGNVKGQKGDAGTISAVTASVANDTGTPSCRVDLGGTPSNRIINLAFRGLKGEKGDTGTVTTGGTTGDFNVTGSLSVGDEMSARRIFAQDIETDGIDTLDISINGKKPFVKYFDCNVDNLSNGVDVTGLVFNDIKTFIDNGGLPVLALTSGDNTNAIYIFKLAYKDGYNIFFESSFAGISASGMAVQHYHIYVYRNNAKLFVSDI